MSQAVCAIALTCLLSVFSWTRPQPQYSQGLLVVYGGQCLVQPNAAYHGYELSPYQIGGTYQDNCTGFPQDGCGLAVIAPGGLGRIVWVRTEHSAWVGPCLAVDVVARSDAYHQIYEIHEVAEVSRAVAAQLGFQYGQAGYAWFGACPPSPDSLFPPPLPYAPPLSWDLGLRDAQPSGYPYPPQELPVDCE